MKTFKHSISAIAVDAINSMSRSELSALAKQAGVSVGKSKPNTVDNLLGAIIQGKLQVKSIFTVTLPPPPVLQTSPYGARHGRTLFVKKFRSYRPDKVLTPVPSE
jgi:hypothetical protein